MMRGGTFCQDAIIVVVVTVVAVSRRAQSFVGRHRVDFDHDRLIGTRVNLADPFIAIG